MTSNNGIILLNATADQAILLTPTELTDLREAISKIVERPVVAGGQLDLEEYGRFGRFLEMADATESLTPTTLSVRHQEIFEALHEQAQIRSSLPLRVRQHCVECGADRIVDPTRKKGAAKDDETDEKQADAVMDGLDLLFDGHPFIAAFAVIEGLATASSGTSQAPATCLRCEGVAIESQPVTFCPGCFTVRDETILLSCPDCGFDFQDRVTSPQVWDSVEAAVGRLEKLGEADRFERAADRFEGGLYSLQRAALTGHVTGGGRPIALCRCAFGGQAGRYVALLFMADCLAWARQPLLGGISSGFVMWRDVVEIRAEGTPQVPSGQGLSLRCLDGTVLTVKDFRGKGVDLDDGEHTFDFTGIYRLVRSLYLDSGGTEAALVPSVLTHRFNPPPGWPPPPPGWTPDPAWRPDPSWPSAPHGWSFWVSG